MKLGQFIKAFRGDEYAKYYVLRKLKKLFGRHTDDFFWDIYTHHYRGEIAELAKEHTILLRPEEYSFKDGRLTKSAAVQKPLYDNWQVLYETILQLQPSSVLEVGCGNGMHLHNLSMLMPGVGLYGLDRSKEQLEYLKELNTSLRADVRLADLSQRLTAEVAPAVDLCFSQAVIMHIKTADHHLRALANMFAMARKQVVLVENWKHHDFLQDILDLKSRKEITWKELHIHYRISSVTGDPLVMICSAVVLDYPRLTDYRTMTDAVKSV